MILRARKLFVERVREQVLAIRESRKVMKSSDKPHEWPTGAGAGAVAACDIFENRCTRPAYASCTLTLVDGQGFAIPRQVG